MAAFPHTHTRTGGGGRADALGDAYSADAAAGNVRLARNDDDPNASTHAPADRDARGTGRRARGACAAYLNPEP